MLRISLKTRCFLTKRYVVDIFLLFITFFLSGCAAVPYFQRSHISFSVNDYSYDFYLQTANTPDERQKGLMFQKKLKPNGGMLFTYTPPQKAAIWMKNTYVSLDVFFVNCDNSLNQYYTHLTPLGLDPVYSDGKICSIIELPAGWAEKMKITKNNKVKIYFHN